MRSLLGKGLAVVLLPTAGAAGLVAALFAIDQHEAKIDRQIEVTVDTRFAAQRVLGLLVDAETGVRGYVATGDPGFLAPYDAALPDLPPALGRLTALHDEAPASVARIEALAAEELGRLDALRAAALAPEQRRRALAAAGKTSMDAIRAEVALVESKEAAEQDALRRGAVRRGSAVAQASTLIAALGCAAAFVVGATFMTRVARRVRRVERNAHRLAAGLPLERVDAGRDEIGALAASLADAAQLVADQRTRLDLALDIGRIQIWELDGDGIAATRHPELGMLPVAEVLAQVHPEDLPIARAALEGVAADGTPREFDVRFTPDRWLSSRVTRVDQPLGGTSLLGVTMDVSEVRRAGAALRESERGRAADALAQSEVRGRHNELVLASAGEGIYAVDADLCCTSVNPAATRLLGFEASELVGRPMHALIHDRHPDGTPYDPADCPVHRSVRDGVPARVENEVFWRRDGSRLPVDYTTFPIVDEGLVRGAVVTFVDASERHGTREETERAAAELRRGIADGELVLHYQPKVRLDTGACPCVEALVRWQRGDNLVYPDGFIPLAEETGAIDDLTRWVVEEALRTAVGWRRDGLDVKIAVNLSPPSLRDDAMVTHLAVAAGRLGSSPSVLEVEMTESALAEDPEALLRNLVALRAMGVYAAIDDFGTGFSSLSYLKVLPVRDLKIDKSFVMNMPHDERDRAIVASTIDLAHSLGLRAVAEGVEDEDVVRLLRERGCDFGQGYHFSRPLPRAEIETWLRAR